MPVDERDHTTINTGTSLPVHDVSSFYAAYTFAAAAAAAT